MGINMTEFQTFLFIFGGFFLLLLCYSLFLVNRGKKFRKNLEKLPKVTFYESVEFLVFSKSKINYTSSLLTKIEVAVDDKNIYIYPRRFHATLFSSMPPLSMYFKSKSFQCEKLYEKTILIKTNAEHLNHPYFWTPFFKTDFELSLTFQEAAMRNELYSRIMTSKSH